MADDGTGKFKKIWDRTDEELTNTIAFAIDACNNSNQRTINFYVLLAGFDAYLEQRKRKTGVGLQPGGAVAVVSPPDTDLTGDLSHHNK